MGLSRHQRRSVSIEVQGRDRGSNRAFGRSLDGSGKVEVGGFKKAVVEVNVSRLICESRGGAAGGHSLG